MKASVFLAMVSPVFSSLGLCDSFLTTNTSITQNRQKYSPKGVDCEIANLATIDIIRCHGYPAKEYEVTTDDGYILAVHRIEHGKANAGDEFVRPVVFLQHDFLGSSADFVIQHHSKSLGFILADNGYDVWMGNFRGNTYSRKHTSLNPNHKDFWAFTIDELAHYDLPAMLSAVLEETREGDLMFVGHGLGSTAAMAMPFYRPDISDKIRLANFMAPMAYISNMRSPIGYLAYEEEILQFFDRYFGDGELFTSNFIIDCLATLFCKNPATVDLCSELIFIIAGTDSNQMNMTLMDAFMHHSPAGTSSKTLLHVLQLVKSGGFHGFDWGSNHANNDHHGLGHGDIPTYNLNDVEYPVAVYFGDNDLLANITDVEKTYSELPFIINSPDIGIHEVEYKNWNHMDFVWGMDAKDFVYHDLIQNLKWCESAAC